MHGQRGIAIGVERPAIGFRGRYRAHGLVAEQLAARVDDSVAVDIQHHEAIVGLDPTGAGSNAIGIVIKKNRVSARDTDRFYAVSVEVQDQGVAGSNSASSEIFLINPKINPKHSGNQLMNSKPVAEDISKFPNPWLNSQSKFFIKSIFPTASICYTCRSRSGQNGNKPCWSCSGHKRCRKSS